LHDGQEHHNDDDKDKNVFGQIIHIRNPRRRWPETGEFRQILTIRHYYN
jgi:hypothetical protein